MNYFLTTLSSRILSNTFSLMNISFLFQHFLIESFFYYICYLNRWECLCFHHFRDTFFKALLSNSLKCSIHCVDERARCAVEQICISTNHILIRCDTTLIHSERIQQHSKAFHFVIIYVWHTQIRTHSHQLTVLQKLGCFGSMENRMVWNESEPSYV